MSTPKNSAAAIRDPDVGTIEIIELDDTLRALLAQRLSKAITIIGGTTELARLLGISTQAISQWEYCPPHRAREIELLSEGKMTRYDLRPDIFGRGANL